MRLTPVLFAPTADRTRMSVPAVFVAFDSGPVPAGGFPR
jgi:hypothetical protein